MHGFNWFDQRGPEGVGFVRALRHLLTNHLPQILPTLGQTLKIKLSESLAQQKYCEADGESE